MVGEKDSVRIPLLFLASLLALACRQAVAEDVLSIAPLAEELRPVRAETVDKRFFDLMDLGRAGLENVRALAGKKQYADALNAWRDYAVLKLRSQETGKFIFHDNALNGSFAPQLRIVLGQEKDPKAPEDTARICGAPGQGGRINWLDPNARFRSCYPGSRLLDAMVARYTQSRDPVYLAKWFEVVGDFCVNQRKLEMSLPVAQRTGDLSYPDSRNGQGIRIQWYLKSHQVTLDAATRAHCILKGIAYLAKALPDGQGPRDWYKEAMRPVNTPPKPESLALIPAGALADIALSLLYDHAPFLLDAYGKPGRTPNQRFSGLTALAGMALTFGEFRAGQELDRIAGDCLQNYVTTTVLPDGGDLEQSFNYNKGFVRESLEFISAYPEGADRPAWVRTLNEAVLKRERLFACLTSPLGNLPRIGTQGGIAPPAVWRESGKEWKGRIAADLDEVAHEPLARQIGCIPEKWTSPMKRGGKSRLALHRESPSFGITPGRSTGACSAPESRSRRPSPRWPSSTAATTCSATAGMRNRSTSGSWVPAEAGATSRRTSTAWPLPPMDAT